MTEKKKRNPEQVVREIKRKTRRRFTSEENLSAGRQGIRIVLEGLRGEESIAAICRKEGISPNLYYTWSKSFPEAGKKRLSGDTQREATSDEVTILKRENDDLKSDLAETFLKYEQIKKNRSGLL